MRWRSAGIARQGLRGMDRAKHIKSCSEGFQRKQGSKCGMKRTHDEAFSGSSMYVMEGTLMSDILTTSCNLVSLGL